MLVALFDLVLYNVYQVIRAPSGWPDFVYFYTFAKAGMTYGYQRIYDPVIQESSLHALFSTAPFYSVVNPPPFAWLLAPLALVPYPLALWIWSGSMIAAVAISSLLLAPSGRYSRVLFMASWLGFLPAYLLVVSAPVAPLVILSLALTWKFIRDDRQTAAGLVLSIGLLKPTLVLLVPLVLLAAGYRRVFLSWLVAALLLVVASCVSLGVDGIRAYISLSISFAANTYSLRWSLVPILGGDTAWLAAAILIAAATILIAWRLRHDGPEPVIAVGVMGSFLINHHMTPGDLMMLLVPVWLILRLRGGVLRNALLGVAWVGGWLGLIFPVSAILVAAAIPLALLVHSMSQRHPVVPASKELSAASIP
ncbi:MAG: glycosyltransferase 87 family protein [Candidatus Dormiibacterota bacterium]